MPESELAGPPPGFLATPEGPGPWPGVVVIHEIYGLNDDMRRIARRFAAEGYAAYGVDLFGARNRVLCMARFMTGLVRASTNRFGIDELRSALDRLGRHSGVDPARLGAVGYCLGGSLAIAWACTDSRLRAIAPHYAMNPRPLEAVRRLCPVVGSYPAKDFTAKGGRALEAALDRYGVPHDIKVYEGAQHSFCNETGEAYDPVAAEDAFGRALAFFGQHLAPMS